MFLISYLFTRFPRGVAGVAGVAGLLQPDFVLLLFLLFH